MKSVATKLDARVRELFDRCVELPTEERRELLARECDGDHELERTVEELIRASHAAPEFLERAAIDSELDGVRAGAWHLERLVSSGGMGDVYLARRDGGDPAWRVAIKVLKRGRNAELVMRRFAAERRSLASLRHPYIVTLIDAGMLDDGRPFLATEFVDGEPIDRAVSRAKLSFEERIELMLLVCAAVQHAHERLIVHCDLKPANILIGEGGVPKLLDFGIARLVSDDAVGDERTAAPLTLGYASPEQLDGRALGTATDVWSLGVVLFELATGRRPFELDGLTRDEVRDQVAQIDAPLAGRAVLGARTSSSNCAPVEAPRELARRMSGDFDAIVATALARDPDRRYGSVAAFALDLRNFLDGRPVVARPIGAITRAARFVARHKAGTALLGIATLSLVVASIVSYRAMRREEREAGLGWAAHAQAITTARWIEELLHELRPTGDESRIRFERALDDVAARLDRQTGAEPEAEGRLRLALGSFYLDVERPDEAERQLGRALELARVERGFDDEDRARIGDLLGRARGMAR